MALIDTGRGGLSTLHVISTAFFIGPALSYARQGWWVAASVLPQLWALAGASKGHLDLVEHERVEVRVLFGLDF